MSELLDAHRRTRLNRENLDFFIQSISKFLNLPISKFKDYFLKKYANKKIIPLKPILDSSNRGFLEIVDARRSVIKFSPHEIDLSKVKKILRTSFFLNRPDQLKTTLPTAGGLCSPELYFLSINIVGLEKGFYHYDAENFNFELIKLLDEADATAIFPDWTSRIKNSSGIFIISAKHKLLSKKYQFRALRLMYLDVGHLMMSLWFSIVNEGLCGTSYGGGIDLEIERVLEIHDDVEVYVGSVVFGLNPT